MGDQQWEQWMRRTPLSRLLIAPLERFHPWGFQGMSAWDVFRFFVVGVAEGALGIRAAAIAFQVFLSIFPVILVLLSLLPLVPVADFQNSLFEALRHYFPGDTFLLVESTVADLLETGVHPEIASLGFVLMLFYASSAINGILLGLNEAHHLERKGNWLLLRAMSLLLMVVFSIFLIVAVLLIVFSGTVLDWLTGHGILALEDLPLIQAVRWLVTLALLGSGWILTCIWVTTPQIDHLLQPEFKGLSLVILALGLAKLIQTSASGSAILLSQSNHFKKMVAINWAMVALAVPLNLLFIPQSGLGMGLVGAAMATFISIGISTLGRQVLLWRIWKRLILSKQTVLICVVLLLPSLILVQWNPGWPHIVLLFTKSAIATAWIAFATIKLNLAPEGVQFAVQKAPWLSRWL